MEKKNVWTVDSRIRPHLPWRWPSPATRLAKPAHANRHLGARPGVVTVPTTRAAVAAHRLPKIAGSGGQVPCERGDGETAGNNRGGSVRWWQQSYAGRQRCRVVPAAGGELLGSINLELGCAGRWLIEEPTRWRWPSIWRAVMSFGAQSRPNGVE
jgi:hypothetical protein